MLSMTGFGNHRLELAHGVLNIQIAAVNHRHCQVSVRSDLRDLSTDERVRSLCRKALRRGSINVNIQWQANESEQIPVEQLRGVYQQLAALASDLNAPAPRLELLSPWLGKSQKDSNDDEMSGHIETALQGAIQALTEMRQQEGQQMQNAFVDMREQLHSICQDMQKVEAGRVEQHRQRLLERVQEAMAGHGVQESDVIREVAVYADRIDISEEIVRLVSHLEQLQELFASAEEQLGKRLEFMLQECGREVNTIGSKAHDAELSQLVVDAKSILEQMREQAANIL